MKQRKLLSYRPDERRRKWIELQGKKYSISNQEVLNRLIDMAIDN